MESLVEVVHVKVRIRSFQQKNLIFVVNRTSLRRCRYCFENCFFAHLRVQLCKVTPWIWSSKQTNSIPFTFTQITVKGIFECSTTTFFVCFAPCPIMSTLRHHRVLCLAPTGHGPIKRKKTEIGPYVQHKQRKQKHVLMMGAWMTQTLCRSTKHLILANSRPFKQGSRILRKVPPYFVPL